MPQDSGPGIPGWFIGFAVFVVVLGVGGLIWRISVARRIARDAGLDPNQATRVALLSDEGVGAAYVASTLASRPARREPDAKSAEERLRDLQALRDKGLVSEDEYAAQRQKILGSI